MEKLVLVLNSNFEPLNVCDYQRAIGLMLTEKATLILNGRGWIKTCREAFPLPSIIRLSHMVHPPRKTVPLSRREIFRRDHYTCQYCGKTGATLTLDHVIPKHMGGAHIWSNLVTACSGCNHHKGGRTLQEAQMSLVHRPSEPSRSAMYIFARYLPENEEWTHYLDGW